MDSNFERHVGAIMVILAWLGVVGLMFLFFQKFWLPSRPDLTQNSQDIQYQILTRSNPNSQSGNQKIMKLMRNPDLHFRIPGSINNTPVIFLIDTGATSTAIPDSIAKSAKLKFSVPIELDTAGGKSTGYFTKIETITLGHHAEFVFNNLSAVITSEADNNQVLLGMNILKYFKIIQESDTLSLELTQTQR